MRPTPTADAIKRGEELHREWLGQQTGLGSFAYQFSTNDLATIHAENTLPVTDTTTPEPSADHDPLSRMVDHILLRRQAARIADAIERPPQPPPATVSLTDLLTEPDLEIRERVEGLWPTDGKTLLTAEKKSGKTTLVGNLLRCLVDGDRFLAARREPGQFAQGHLGFKTNPVTDRRRVVLLDFEMTRQKLKEWLRDQHIRQQGAVHVELMRGRRWDVRDDKVRADWAKHLAAVAADIVIVDPIGPVLHGLGIDEQANTAAGQYLTALDQLAAEAGVRELFVTHHTGWAGERSRGASAFEAWPDAIWRLLRPDGAERFFAAEGRDVYVPETLVQYDRATRRMWLGEGNRVTTRTAGHVETVAAIVTETEGLTLNKLKPLVRDALSCGTPVAEDAIKGAVATGRVHHHHGPNRAQLHYPGPRCSDCRAGDPR